MRNIKNFIEGHRLSGCPGSYRRGVVFNENGKICRMFINFTTSKMDKHNPNFSKIFYAGRGKKDQEKYFVEDTTNNKENLKMMKNTTEFPIYVKMENGYFDLGLFKIKKIEKINQLNPSSGKSFSTIGFNCEKVI